MASILGAFQAAQASANRANLDRYKEGIGIYDTMISNWKKGGGFVKGAKATLARTKTKDVASGMQSLVSSGLAGTTMAAGLGKAWEEDVGAPARLNIADIAGQRLMQAQQAKAGFIERREDYGPDPSLVSSVMQGMGQASAPDPYGGRSTFGANSFYRPATGASASWGTGGAAQPSIASTARRVRSPYPSSRVTASTPSTGSLRTLIDRRRY